MADDRTPAQKAHDDSEREAFGAEPLRNPDGSLMETGHGSAFAAMRPADKAHFHMTAAIAAYDGVLALAKQLTDAIGRLAPLNDAALKASQAAKADAQKTAAQKAEADDQRAAHDAADKEASDRAIADKAAFDRDTANKAPKPMFGPAPSTPANP